MKLILTLICLSFITNLSPAQELKRKRKQTGDYLEEYTVLKENKKIKHGEYVKYELDILDNKSISEIGQFEHGKKTGKWYIFFSSGLLRSEGQFEDDQKRGIWIYYYEPREPKTNIISMLTTNKGIIFKEDGTISIDKSNSIKSSEGVFLLDIKIGAWNYYSRQGQLLHQFNHSSEHLSINNIPDSLNNSCPYLGGYDRFYSNFYTQQRKLGFKLPSIESSVTIVIRVKDNPISFELTELYGDKDFAQIVAQTLRTLEQDYIFEFVNNPDGEITFTANYSKQNYRIVLTASFE
jgi:hypothetical protein